MPVVIPALNSSRDGAPGVSMTMKRASIAAVKAQYKGMQWSAHLEAESPLKRMRKLTVVNRAGESAALISGVTAQLTAI